jgi:DNA mismatch repair protein MSH6
MSLGYKVGRVDQTETALGAEMRMANAKEQEKGKGKAQPKENKAKDKMVRRSAHFVLTISLCIDVSS